MTEASPNDLFLLKIRLTPGGYRIRMERNSAYGAVSTLDQALAALHRLRKQARVQGISNVEEFTVEVEEGESREA